MLWRGFRTSPLLPRKCQYRSARRNVPRAGQCRASSFTCATVAHVPPTGAPSWGSGYPQRYPDPENDESPAEAELAKSLFVRRNDGGRCRSRTYDPLIKSQLLYQLS